MGRAEEEARGVELEQASSRTFETTKIKFKIKVTGFRLEGRNDVKFKDMNINKIMRTSLI